jgi:hypothetical protein
MTGEGYRDRRVVGCYLRKPIEIAKSVNSIFGASLKSGIISLENAGRGIFDVIYLDIDDADRFKKVLSILNDNGFANKRVYFTGRGYNVFIDLKEPIKALNYTNALEVIRGGLTAMGITEDLIDWWALNAHVCCLTVPYTVNSKFNDARKVVEIDEKTPYTDAVAYSKRGYSWSFADMGILKNELGVFADVIKEVLGNV